MRLIWCGVLGLVLLGCKTQTRVETKPYFNIDSLIHEQVHWLVARHAKLEKRATVGPHSDQHQWQPDSTQWKKEFEVFRQLDGMNRPGFKNAYTKTTMPDNQSNLLVTVYTATVPAPIRWLKVYYLQRPENIRRVEALCQESNVLFSSERTLTWELEDTGPHTMLTHYIMQGFQKTVASDSMIYRMEGSITF